MALITVADENRRIEDVDEIRSFLEPFGIWYEEWNVAGRISTDAPNEEVLEANAPEMTAEGGDVDSVAKL